MKRDYTKAITWGVIGIVTITLVTKVFQILTQ